MIEPLDATVCKPDFINPSDYVEKTSKCDRLKAFRPKKETKTYDST